MKKQEIARLLAIRETYIKIDVRAITNLKEIAETKEEKKPALFFCQNLSSVQLTVPLEE